MVGRGQELNNNNKKNLTFEKKKKDCLVEGCPCIYLKKEKQSISYFKIISKRVFFFVISSKS